MEEGVWILGSRPASEIYRCTRQAKSTGRRCRNPAVRGTDVCKKHGGNVMRQLLKELEDRVDDFLRARGYTVR